MSVAVWLSKIGKLFLTFIGIFRRLLCCFRRRRRNSDTPLPMTVKDGNVHHIPSLPTSSKDLYDGVVSWMWDDCEAPSGVTVVGNSHPNRNPATPNGLQRANSNSDNSDPEIDFFQDMVPAIKKPDKILLRKPEKSYEHMDNAIISKRLAADSFAPLVNSGELEQWHEDEVGWEDSLNNDSEYDADAALRESKLIERERRVAENLRKKQAKEITRPAKKDHLATKIS